VAGLRHGQRAASPDLGVGQIYLEVCERARGDCAEEAQAAATGIRRVLQGEARDFGVEYPCHSPTEARWFHLTVTPVRADRRAGAVVMHVDITERKRAEEAARRSQTRLRDLGRTENALRESDEKFHLLADNITDAFWIRSADMREVHYISPAFERIWGHSAESLYANPQQWPDFTLPEDRERVLGVFAALTRLTKSGH
jgi:PAS domain-containing protein